jgi:hypothetical protein
MQQSIFFHLMEFNLKLTAVIGMVAVLAIALAAGTVAHQQVNAVDCKGNPHGLPLPSDSLCGLISFCFISILR